SNNCYQCENYFITADINVYVHLVIEHSGSALPKRVK
ncbi:spore germination protein, partial [Bacillus cereus]|nr:spore germination protein [Bacillus cereus]